MLANLEVKNFRSLEHVLIPKLGRVNLIVGKNNSGKSTVLESLRVLAKNGNPMLLEELIVEHDEYLSSQPEGSPADDDVGLFAFRNLFHGRQLPEPGHGPISIGTADKSDYVRIDHRLFSYENVEVKDEEGETMVMRRRKVHENGAGLFPDPVLLQHALIINSSRVDRVQIVDLSSRDELRRRGPTYESERDTAVSFVPTQFVSPDRLAQLWDTIALTDAESIVTKALMVIEPAVQGLAFVKRATNRTAYRFRRPSTAERSPIIKLSGLRHPLPLNSMGDGMSRVLQIVMSAFAARDGYFLIDEFENGLHYSIQQQVWELIFRLAEELNSQVFATTHSWDCIKAFRDAAKDSGESGVLFRLGRSVRVEDKRRLIATVFDEENLWKITQADIEVR
jgi:predicted ATPase